MSQLLNTPTLAVHVVFERDGRTLLLERRNTGWADGQLSLVAGHVMPGEDIYTAAVRETAEEIGVLLGPCNLAPRGVMQRLADGEDRMDVFFTARNWSQEPYNAEPEKCARLVWTTAADRVQMDVVAYIDEALSQRCDAIWLRVFGW